MSPAADPRAIARIQEAADQKIKKATEEWEAERAKLNSKISRLEGAVAEAIARASNPLRMTQSVKEQFEFEMNRLAKEKTEAEQALLRAKTEWEQEIETDQRGGQAAAYRSNHGATDPGLQRAGSKPEGARSPGPDEGECRPMESRTRTIRRTDSKA